MGVVAAAQGYPGSYERGHVIQGLSEAGALEETVLFHGGTRSDGGQTLTNGGRVLCITALGRDVLEARGRAYQAFDVVRWSGKTGRRDIGLPRPPRLGGRYPEPASAAPTMGRRHGERGGAL